MSTSSKGAASTILLILAAVLIVMIIVVFVVLRINASRTETPETPGENETANNEPPPPVYEATLGDVKFIFEDARDLGNVLRSNTNYQEDLTTTERFIKVTIGAQNKGKLNVQRGLWNMGNIVDSDGRNFVSISDYAYAYSYLTEQSQCQELLKPEFEPTPCIKIYEVSKVSTGLKVQVSFSPAGGAKKEEGLIDLVVE
ncbi:MAG: hypothetical protein A3D44_03415 [Candidatus Staskawiczbacteria bacterium RIFCSPHIGHO2_02_FULL_42_22]|uniref:DUF4352 domain-containing protein n=1 Tax=Candidatus Staskawiczbacteria bacterium RIFCSPHIGHO2_02_FULL_42_22 TaxID=1802207 RepID=A0A1G2I4P5_9BACT|nr:MAG: hypothetical protein A3D44_03415 [Candidatus Staskawiczbacteria bacterium RIFCSPHIGHO2_02_FULL_42_22]